MLIRIKKMCIRDRKEVVEYAQRGQIYTSDHEKVSALSM